MYSTSIQTWFKKEKYISAFYLAYITGKLYEITDFNYSNKGGVIFMVTNKLFYL